MSKKTHANDKGFTLNKLKKDIYIKAANTANKEIRTTNIYRLLNGCAMIYVKNMKMGSGTKSKALLDSTLLFVTSSESTSFWPLSLFIIINAHKMCIHPTENKTKKNNNSLHQRVINEKINKEICNANFAEHHCAKKCRYIDCMLRIKFDLFGCCTR